MSCAHVLNPVPPRRINNAFEDSRYEMYVPFTVNVVRVNPIV